MKLGEAAGVDGAHQVVKMGQKSEADVDPKNDNHISCGKLTSVKINVNFYKKKREYLLEVLEGYALKAAVHVVEFQERYKAQDVLEFQIGEVQLLLLVEVLAVNAEAVEEVLQASP